MFDWVLNTLQAQLIDMAEKGTMKKGLPLKTRTRVLFNSTDVSKTDMFKNHIALNLVICASNYCNKKNLVNFNTY